MVEKRVSFNLDEELAFKIKQRALDERITQKELLTKWITEGLQSKNKINRVSTTFNIESEIMKAIKIRAVELGITQTELIERYLKEGLERDTKKR